MSLGLRQRGQRGGGGAQLISEIQRTDIDIDVPCLHPGEVEDVADQSDQVLAIALDDLHISLLLGVQLARQSIAQELRQCQHGVQRGANLVRQMRQQAEGLVTSPTTVTHFIRHGGRLRTLSLPYQRAPARLPARLRLRLRRSLVQRSSSAPSPRRRNRAGARTSSVFGDKKSRAYRGAERRIFRFRSDEVHFVPNRRLHRSNRQRTIATSHAGDSREARRAQPHCGYIPRAHIGCPAIGDGPQHERGRRVSWYGAAVER